VNLTNLRDGTFTTQDMSKILKASKEGKRAPIFIRTESDVTVMQIRAIARRLRTTEKIELLIIDYLQLIQPSDRREKNRQVQIAEISREIKLCAKELGIPVIVLSQLNKDGETRESLSLQQDCDQMWRIVPPASRAESRKGKREAQAEESEEEQLNRPCFIDVKYNREGETGFVPMTFLRPFTLFQDRYD
jgi:replicative DNA helicase